MNLVFCAHFINIFFILRAVELRYFIHPKCLGGVCDSSSFHSFIFKLNTLWLITHWTCVHPIFFAHLIIFLELLNLDIITSTSNDCSHIEDVHRRRRSRAEFGLVLASTGQVYGFVLCLISWSAVSGSCFKRFRRPEPHPTDWRRWKLNTRQLYALHLTYILWDISIIISRHFYQVKIVYKHGYFLLLLVLTIEL